MNDYYQIHCGGKDTEFRYYAGTSKLTRWERWLFSLCVWIECGFGRVEFIPEPSQPANTEGDGK